MRLRVSEAPKGEETGGGGGRGGGGKRRQQLPRLMTPTGSADLCVFLCGVAADLCL